MYEVTVNCPDAAHAARVKNMLGKADRAHPSILNDGIDLEYHYDNASCALHLINTLVRTGMPVACPITIVRCIQ